MWSSLTERVFEVNDWTLHIHYDKAALFCANPREAVTCSHQEEHRRMLIITLIKIQEEIQISLNGRIIIVTQWSIKAYNETVQLVG